MMEREISQKDIKLFFFENLKLIISIAVIFTLIGIGLASYVQVNRYISLNESVTSSDNRVSEENIQVLLGEAPEELSNQELQMVDDYLNEDSYYFRVFIEHPDYTSFGRTGLLYEAAINENTIKQVEEELDINFQYNPEHFIHLNYNSNTFLHTFIFKTGNRENSYNLAQKYFSIITNGELEILEDRYVYIFNEPTLITENTTDNEDLIGNQPEFNKIDVAKSVAVAGIASILIGFLLGFITALLKEKFNNTIGHLFNYPLSYNHSFIEIETKNKEGLYQLITSPTSNKLVVSDQNDLIERLSRHLKKDFINIENSILDVDYQVTIEEIYLIVLTNQTSKKWFVEQINYSNNYEIPIKTIKLY